METKLYNDASLSSKFKALQSVHRPAHPHGVSDQNAAVAHDVGNLGDEVVAAAGVHAHAEMVAQEGEVTDRGAHLVAEPPRLGVDLDALGADREGDPVARSAVGDPQGAYALPAGLHLAEVAVHGHHPPVQAVVLADEARHEGAFRFLVEGFGRGRSVRRSRS